MDRITLYASRPDKPLPNILRDEFQADSFSEVPDDIFISAYTSARRVIENPERFPRADFAHFESMSDALFCYWPDACCLIDGVR